MQRDKKSSFIIVSNIKMNIYSVKMYGLTTQCNSKTYYQMFQLSTTGHIIVTSCPHSPA